VKDEVEKQTNAKIMKPEPLTVYMFISHIGLGGDWTAVRSMCRGLRARGHRVGLAAANTRKIKDDIYTSVVECTIHRGVKQLVRSAWHNRKAFPTDVDVLHAHSPNALLYALLIRKWRCHKAKVVMTYHWQSPDTLLTAFMKRILFKFADRLHLNSLGSHAYMKTFYRQPDSHIRFVSLGTETDAFDFVSEAEKVQLRKAWSLPDSAIVLLFAGRHDPEKNIPIIIEFVNRHAERYPNLYLLLTNDGPLRGKLEAMAKSGQAADRIRFLGRVPDIREIHGVADLLLLTSTSLETFGLVCVEAGLCGTPCLRSDIFGAEDQIVEGVNGWSYPKDDPDAFESKLCEILDHPQWLRPAGEAARQIYLERFNNETASEGLEEIYYELREPGGP